MDQALPCEPRRKSLTQKRYRRPELQISGHSAALGGSHLMITTPDGKKLVTLIPGDGIGPECVDSAKRIVEASGAKVAWEVCHAGESVFKQGIASGVPTDTI